MIRVRENDVSSEMIVDGRKPLLRRDLSLPAHCRGRGNASCENNERSRKEREIHAYICLRVLIARPKCAIAFVHGITNNLCSILHQYLDVKEGSISVAPERLRYISRRVVKPVKCPIASYGPNPFIPLAKFLSPFLQVINQASGTMKL
jgi:hypothetical protein